jgi:hypothetical protein
MTENCFAESVSSNHPRGEDKPEVGLTQNLNLNQPDSTPGDFACQHHRQFRRILKKSIMINDEERSDCNESIIRGLLTNQRIPNAQSQTIPRNARAAASLKHLANDAVDYVDDSWKMLQSYYQPDSEAWRDAICQATKDVGFSNMSRSFPYFLTKLVGLFSQSNSFAA